MADTDSNITVGSGRVYLATVGTALPTITGTLAGSITWTSWNTPGWNAEEVEIEFTQETIDFTPAGQKTATLDKEIKKGATVKFILYESDADAVNKFLNTSSLASAVVSDGGDTAETYTALAIETDLLVYHFKKVRLTPDGSLTLSDEEFTKLPVLAKCFQYLSDTAGQRIYRIHERTA